MKVSICCITYNQEKFIGQAIESFLMQRTNFDFEIVIGDDFSKDSTLEICDQYKLKYFGKIKLIKNAQNIGMIPNFVQTLKNCYGEYIALCEGDDFWTDHFKLQKQIDILEKHSEYVGCFHNTEERYEDDDAKASFLYCNYPSARIISFADLSMANAIPTCSVVFRNKLPDQFPDWYFKLRMGDWPLHLLNAQYGDFWYIPKVMGVHRLHKNSSWMLQDSNRNIQLVREAYDIMEKEFQENKVFANQLAKGKESFFNSIQDNRNGTQYKRRLKNFFMNMIERL